MIFMKEIEFGTLSVFCFGFFFPLEFTCSLLFYTWQLKEIVNHGKLVSDEIIIDLLSKRLQEGEAKGESGFILDGFPRTIRQAVSASFDLFL